MTIKKMLSDYNFDQTRVLFIVMLSSKFAKQYYSKSTKKQIQNSKTNIKSEKLVYGRLNKYYQISILIRREF